MLFPGMKYVCRKLELYSSGSIVFGEYRNFQIRALDGDNKKIMMLKMAESPQVEELLRLKKTYKIRKIDFDAGHSMLEVVFREIIRPYSARKIISFIDDLIDLCESRGITSIVQCDYCENTKVEYYTYGDQPMVMCSTCHNVKKSEVENLAIEFKEKENRYIGGISGALLFSLPGILIQGLLFIFLKRVAALSSVLYCFLALKGYLVFKGKPTSLASGFIIFISLFMTVSGTFLTYCGFLYYKVQSLDKVIQLLNNVEIRDELLQNIILQLIISSFYLIFEFFSLKKRWTFMKILSGVNSHS